MKATTLVLGLMMSLSTFAAEVPVMAIENDVYSLSNVTSEFKINKEMGRAWVETTIDDRVSADDSIGLDTYRQKAEGLSFDQNTSEIVLDVEGARVVCATVRTVGRSIFRHDKLTMTGNCKFSHTKKKIVVDNGYETYNRQQVIVSIVTK